MRTFSHRLAVPAAVLALAVLPAMASAALVSFTTSGTYNTAGATGVVGSSGNVLQITSTDTLTFNSATVSNLAVPDNGFAIATSFGSFTFAGSGLDNFSNVGFTLNIAQTVPTPTPPGTTSFPSTISGFLFSNNGNITLTFSSPTSRVIAGNGVTPGIIYTVSSPQNNLGGGVGINGSVAVAPIPAPAVAGAGLLGLIGWARRRRNASTVA